MATADLDFNIEITGTPQELVSVLEIMFEYKEGKNGVYFSFTSIYAGDKEFSLHSSGKDEILSAVQNIEGAVRINSSGPFGRYGELDDVDIFREMAQAAPGARFTASIEGFAGYADQSLKATLADGLLHVSTYYLSDDSRGEAELEYYQEYLPYEKFIELFRLDGDEFDEDMYEDFIGDNFSDSIGEFFEETEYEEFIDLLDAECPLTEDEYSEIAQQFAGMDCESFEDYFDREGWAQCEEYTYDPVEKKYLNVEHPRMKSGVAYSINDDIRAYLQSIGHPCDDETIAALSVEDVYAIMAGTYGKDDSAADEDSAAGETAETADAPEADDCAGTAEIAEALAGAYEEETDTACDDACESAQEMSAEADCEEADCVEVDCGEEACACQHSIEPTVCADDVAADTTHDPSETEPVTAAAESAVPENKSPAAKKSARVWLIVLLIVIILIALAVFVFGPDSIIPL